MTKIIILLASGALITFPAQKHSDLGCFEQGQKIVESISTYQGPGPEQGWYLNNSRRKIQVGGFYCE